MEIVEGALKALGIDGFRSKYLSELSGGECRRCILLWFWLSIRIYFLDEPATYLDITISLRCWRLLKV